MFCSYYRVRHLIVLKIAFDSFTFLSFLHFPQIIITSIYLFLSYINPSPVLSVPISSPANHKIIGLYC